MSSKVLASFAAAFLVAAAIYLSAPIRYRTFLPGVDRPIAINARSVTEKPFVMFRALAPRDAHGRVAMVTVAAPDGARHVSTLSCARVHYGGGTGICLVEEQEGTTVKHVAVFFNGQFQQGHRIALDGLPIRTRVSRDGRRAAITVYGEQHLPDGEERLATDTILVDATTGTVIANLKEFTLSSADLTLSGPLDFASVTFAQDNDHFFATVFTEQTRYIVTGSISDRRLTVVATGLANEGLSPNGHRLIAKKRVGDRGHWQLLVLDLATHVEHALNQGSRSIDDQVEWLDDEHVVYHDATIDGTGVWALRVDGATPPRLLIPDAYSPSVER